MSKADDVFIRQFIIVLVLLAAYGVGAAVLGVWIAGAARDASAGSERSTLERIAPVGRLKLGEPGQRTRTESAASESAAKTAAATAEGSSPDTSTPEASDAAGATVVAAASAGASPAASSDPTAGADNKLGEAIYKQYCFACHLTGVAEAPPTGNTEAWAPRAATGFEALYQSVINGKGAMLPRSGFVHLTDDELRAGIRYLLAAANVTAE